MNQELICTCTVLSIPTGCQIRFSIDVMIDTPSEDGLNAVLESGVVEL